MEFLAHRISSNVRVLEGALNRLFAYASLVGREIDLDMTQECLADILRISERKVTVDEIIRKVADHYNLRISDLLSARRARQVARPRQVAMYLAKMLTSRSLPDIGRRFGGRDHTTVIHAVRKIEELRADRQPDRRGRRAAAPDARGLSRPERRVGRGGLHRSVPARGALRCAANVLFSNALTVPGRDVLLALSREFANVTVRAPPGAGRTSLER